MMATGLTEHSRTIISLRISRSFYAHRHFPYAGYDEPSLSLSISYYLSLSLFVLLTYHYSLSLANLSCPFNFLSVIPRRHTRLFTAQGL